MNNPHRATGITALAALLLTLMVLTFVATNPWMLLGVPPVLLAIAAIVRAINATGGPSTRHATDDSDDNGAHEDPADADSKQDPGSDNDPA